MRSVDHMTQSQVNASTVMMEKMGHDTLDVLIEIMRSMMVDSTDALSMYKADIDSAYRRIPLRPEHRCYATIAFKHKSMVLLLQHMATPFGAVSSVHNWERVGALICAIGRRVLKLPLARYVDDFFSVDREKSVGEASDVLRRLIDCLLGPGAAAPDKLMHSNPLTILGVQVSIDQLGVTSRPDAEKAFKWSCRIQGFLETGVLHSGDASKLAGALQWAGQQLFRRLGRAMLRPIFRYALRRVCSACIGECVLLWPRQIKATRNAIIDDELRMALHWWLAVLQLGLT